MKRVFLVFSLFVLSQFIINAQCIKGNCFDGTGTFVYNSGAKYEGKFKEGRIHEYGTLYFSDGRVYTGEWYRQMRHGKGKMKYADKSVYVGDFIENSRQGKGKITLKSGDIYEGDWKEDRISGKGKYTFLSGHIYEGDFINGQFEGNGTMTYSSGATYTGEWKSSKRNGKGTYIDANGISQSGMWHEGEFQGEEKSFAVFASESHPSNERLTDCNTYYCGNGRGRYTYKDGSFFEGDFRNNLPDGKGICYYANGDRYEGGWKHNAPHGEGIMYFSSGVVYNAVWNQGYPVKKIHAYKQSQNLKKQQSKTSENKVTYSKEVKIWAVIVGIASYNHMPTLKYTDDDAYQIYAFLKSPEGGAIPNDRIALLVDEAATRDNIINAMKTTFSKADENDVVMLYYSGHGLPGSFLPIDFDGYNNMLQHHEIKNILDESKAKHKICFADACHSGSMLAMKSPFNATQMNSFFEGFEKTNGGTALFTSSKSEEISMETSGLRQGIFSHFLIRGLGGEADSDRNKIVTMDELYNFVYGNVTDYTKRRQTPSIAGSYDPNMPVALVR